MIIYAGQRTRNRRLGRVADYCPLCREIRPCQVTRIESVTHVYFIPVSRAEIKGHIVKCEHCRCVLNTDVAAYHGYSRSYRDGVEELIEKTNPGIEERVLQYLEMEERAASRDISPAERFELLHAPFLAVAAAVEQRAAGLHVDDISARFIVALAGAIFILIAPSIFNIGGTPAAVVLWSGAVLTAASFIVLIWSLATDPRRYVRNRLRHVFVQGLADLDPTREELDMVFRGIRGRKMAIGRKLSPEKVLEMLAEAEDAGEPGGGAGRTHAAADMAR